MKLLNMKIKNIIRLALLSFVIASISYLIVDSFNDHSHSIREPNASKQNVIAYYFHRNRRCVTCRKIETYAQDALQSHFYKEFKSGELEWRVVNIESPGNEHFANDYSLTSSSLVLVDARSDGKDKWKNLSEVWKLVKNKTAFYAYVQQETGKYLEQTHD
jgi:hypothetical protein